MPEGPEIRRDADRIARAIADREATGVAFAFDHLKKYQKRLAGQRVTAVETRGKAMLIRFANDLVIYSHNQLYGRWYVKPAGSLPRTRRTLRLAIHNQEKSALLYSASEIAVLRPSQLERHPFLSKLGPDVLDSGLAVDDLVSRLSDRRFARRRLASLLLDQGFVAGIGNYLRSEILFVAGVHPARRPKDLSEAECAALAHAIRRVPRQSYRTGGITNDPERAKALRARGVRRGEYRHHVFTRAGMGCWNCRSIVREAAMAGRRIYFCLRCQAPRPEGDG